MPENNQASDKTKPEATGSSSTQPGSQAIDMNHTNVIVPHRISNHDKLVQTMVMVDGEWVNVNDTNDQKNVQEDMHKVNRVVTEAQKDIINAQNAADSAVKSADSAISASKVNSDAIAAQGEAISEAKIALDSAAAEIQLTASNAASDAAKIRADVAQMQSEVDTAKAANSATVEALKSDVSAAKQDIQAARQANENVAKQLDDYTKQAQAQGKTIKDIQNAQDGYTATLADVKGNVSKISDAVDGLSASLKDDQDNVATIKAKADELSATLTDHDKNIAQLTASAKELSSTLEDADGRLSKVEQTAATLTNEFADQQGHLNRVEQTAQGTEQTVANQQGQINTIKTDATGIHETLTGQGNQIATINVTLDGLKSKYEGVSGDLNKLKNGNYWKTVNGAFDANQYTQTAHIFYQDMQAKNTPDPGWFYFLVEAPRNDRVTQTLIKDNSENSWSRFYNGTWSAWAKGATQLDIDSLSNRITTNSTQITQNKQAIALKANQSNVVNLSGEVNQNKAQLKVQADQISSKVSSSDFKTLDNKVSGAIARINENATAIDQTNQKISLKADQTEVDKVKQTATQNSSRLNVMANEISSKVTSTDVNNIINGKGYATTSTVQSLITQKAGTINESITNLTSKVNSNGGQVQQITASIDGIQSTVASKADKSQIAQLSNLVQSKVSSTDFNNLRKAVDLQTLESADANNLKTNGHYFVHNLANNPVGGWVYVDVTGNGNDRIRQDVYQDSGNKHKYRRWFGNSWTNWSEGATESEITQLSNTFQSKISDAQISINDLKDKTLWKSTYSVDLNNVVTQQKIFVTGGSNLPPGLYWWYVQVEPGYDSRIVQYAVSDRDNLHYSRQYDGSKWSAWSQGATESEITQLRDDINLRVKSGDLLSQINIEAGRTLIQSNKIYFDADSFVMSPNSKAFIPSAFITNLSADKITTGTLDASKLHVKNFSANDIEAGTLSGVTIKAGDTDFFQTSQDNIYWITNNGRQSALIGRGEYVTFPGLNIFDSNAIHLGTWAGADLENGTIKDTGGSLGHPKFNIELPADSAFDLLSKNGEMGSTMVPLDNSRISGWVDQHEFFYLKQTQGFHTELNPDLNTSQFRIQKDDHIGAYFGEGNNGNQITFNFGGNDGGLNVNGPLHVTGSKNSIVETRQGYLAINAYETAEYYFGDIGENNTGDTSQVVIGIDRIFNEVVNTDIQYQVFVTPYSNAHVWVEKRYNNRFIVKSDRPNAEFGWELKAKRKGYESNRLRRVNVDFNQMDLKGEN